MTIGERIRQLRQGKGMTLEEVAKRIGVGKATVLKYENGLISNIPSDKIESLASVLESTPQYIMGWERESIGFPLDSFISGADMVKVPLLGDIACGSPILAEQNIDGYISIAPGISCDFVLRCKGDSMAPRFLDGDYVLIRQQEDVNDGQIAAVLIDGEATLKRIHHIPGGIILIPDNQEKYEAKTYIGVETENIRIMGRAVGYQRAI